MNYKRGYQIVVHDRRLNGPRLEGPPNPDAHWWKYVKVVAPEAYHNIEVDSEKQTCGAAFSLLQDYCAKVRPKNDSPFDALHIMAHGYEGAVELGKDWLWKQNLHVTAKITNRFRYVVFHSCLVGRPPQGSPAFLTSNTFGGSQFARKIAQHTRAKVILARGDQIYDVVRDKADRGKGIIDFGDWEGPVDLYERDVPVRTFNSPLDILPFNLERHIFAIPPLR